MPAYTHGLIREGLAALGKDLGAAKVAVLGLAFKNNTNDLRNTPSAAGRAGATRIVRKS